MAAFELSAEAFPSVRAAIGSEATEVTLPDEMLALAVYKGEAERYVMRNLTEAQYTAEGYTDEVEYAAILYLASLAVKTLRPVTQEKIAGGGSLTYASFDANKLAKDLSAQADARIADIIKATGGTDAASDDDPNFFGVSRKVYPEDYCPLETEIL